jgi:hypothetical protein
VAGRGPNQHWKHIKSFEVQGSQALQLKWWGADARKSRRQEGRRTSKSGSKNAAVEKRSLPDVDTTCERNSSTLA